jgi:hypothetical protein
VVLTYQIRKVDAHNRPSGKGCPFLGHVPADAAAPRDVLGKDHPDTLARINNPAMSFDQQGKYAEAKAIRRRADGKLEQTMLLTHHSNQTLEATARKK